MRRPEQHALEDSLAWRDPCSSVAIGPLGANCHWLSDIVAGAIVGVATGVVAAKIGRGSPDTV